MKKFLLAVLLIFFCAENVNAAKIDAYREILLGNSYTIRYDNLTPAPRVTNRDRVELYGKSGLAVENNDYLLNKPKSGVITCAGNEKYEEVGNNDFYICRLSKNGEDFFFTKYKKGNKFEYFGTKKNHVKANEKNYLAEIVEGVGYGDADMSRLMNAILPAEYKSASQSIYRFIAEGTLENNLSYEDFRADDGGITEVVRYYFEGNKLLKISSASYHKNSEGKIEGRRCIIKINEFSAVPDRTLLNLPNGVKDDTKRNKNTQAVER